eukprot:1160465-Pelagomonas_calceolata.AAC.7
MASAQPAQLFKGKQSSGFLEAEASCAFLLIIATPANFEKKIKFSTTIKLGVRKRDRMNGL